jgi:hypothetical protein
MKTLRWLPAVALVLAACSPTFNWRAVQPEGMDLSAMFPCKPDHETRELPLAGAAVRFTIYACRTGEVTFALGSADVGDPRRVGPALDALGQAAVANLRGTVRSRGPAQLDGMTPYREAEVLELAGRGADGSAVQARVVLFARGTRVYQATAFGARLPAEATEPFFTGTHLNR